MTARGPDLARLARACHLHAAPIGARLWSVTGGAGIHLVDAELQSCDCTDYAMHPGEPCKHILAVRLRQGDAVLLDALGRLVPLPRRPRRKALAA